MTDESIPETPMRQQVKAVVHLTFSAHAAIYPDILRSSILNIIAELEPVAERSPIELIAGNVVSIIEEAEIYDNVPPHQELRKNIVASTLKILWAPQCYNGITWKDIDRCREGGDLDMGGIVENLEKQSEAIADRVIRLIAGENEMEGWGGDALETSSGENTTESEQQDKEEVPLTQKIILDSSSGIFFTPTALLRWFTDTRLMTVLQQLWFSSDGKHEWRDIPKDFERSIDNTAPSDTPSPLEWKEYQVMSNVKVKLNTHGISFLNNSPYGVFNNKLDEEKFYHFPLWMFMAIFGPELYNGGKHPFDSLIYISSD